MKKRLRLAFFSLLAALVAVPTLVVFAKEISSVTITGPGIEGQVTLDGSQDMYNLMDAGLIDTLGFMAAPTQKLGTPYTILVNLDLEGKIVPFVQMEYYPMEKGQAGYVHTTGRFDGNSALDPADEWTLMAPKADSLLRDLLGAQGVTLQPAVSAAAAAPAVVKPEVAAPAPAVQSEAPISAPAAPRLPALPLSLIAAAGLLIVLAGAGLLLRRRIVSN